MSALSTADKIRLARLSLEADFATGSPKQGGRLLADALRSSLPDIDDVTIGRVVLEIGQFAGRLAAQSGDMGLLALGNQAMCAGLDLTAIEWQDGAA